jgi:hypothetical protein
MPAGAGVIPSIPAPIRNWLAEHHVETAYERGWSQLSNGDLIEKAEISGFDITTGKAFFTSGVWQAEDSPLPIGTNPPD